MPSSAPSSRLRLLPLLAAAFVVALPLVSCGEEKHSTIADVDPETFPTMLTSDVSTLVSDSGYTRYHITTDLWLMFDEAAEPFWSFPTGLDMEKYDDDMNIDATFVCDSARYLSNRRLWEFIGNVRMINSAGDRFATQHLFWDQNVRKVYSDSFIHIERIDRILEGYGFESNETMTAYTINRPSGIFPVNPEARRQAEPSDSLAPADSLQQQGPVTGRAARQARRTPPPAAASTGPAPGSRHNDTNLKPKPVTRTAPPKPRPAERPTIIPGTTIKRATLKSDKSDEKNPPVRK